MKIEQCTIESGIAIDASATVHAVAQKLRDEQTRHVIIVEQDAPVGIISSVDVVNKVVADGKNAEEVTAKDIMTTPVFTLEMQDDIGKGYFEMVKRNIYSAPVVQDGALKGTVSLQELMVKLKEIGEKNGTA